jgi:DNA-binding response OmpR family regulator
VVDDDSGSPDICAPFWRCAATSALVHARRRNRRGHPQGEPPDIVLLDVAMPGMDGLQTLQGVESRTARAAGHHALGTRARRDHRRGRPAWGADYVVKPDDPEGLGEIALDAAIKQAFERNRLVNELSDLRRS